MKGIYFDGSKAKLENSLSIPERKENQSLIKVIAAGICNTDKEILKGYRPDFKGIMGHEFVGIVEDSCDKFLIGKKVVGEINEGCGKCLYCMTGREKHCINRKVLGINNKNGCFTEYITLNNKNIHVIEKNTDFATALWTEPLAAALQIPNDYHFQLEKNVAIVGDGRLAYTIAAVLSLYGLDLTVVGHHMEKLEHFKKLGKVALKTDETFETVIDATGSKSGIDSALNLLRKQGTLILKTTYAGTKEMDMSRIVVDEITVKGSRCGPFKPAINLLEKGLVKLPEIEFYNLEDFENAFNSHAFKAGFKIN